jgi:hypothetical protein
MAKQNISTLKNWFKRGLKPLQQHFFDWMDSYWHKDESIPISQIIDLQEILNTLPPQAAINSLMAVILPEIINTSADVVYSLTANKRLQTIIIIPANNDTLKIGTINGAEDIMVSTTLTAGAAFVLDCAVYAINDIPIYINGITGATQILIYKR